MREVLNNQQIVCPGDATQFMHAIFSSDHEMMTFYLTLNRFINPSSYLVERSDRQRLEDLENVLFGNVAVIHARLNTLRIMKGDQTTLTIKHVPSGQEILRLPLTQYLLLSKIHSHTGDEMGDQEYLDRQDSYTLLFFIQSSDMGIPKICPRIMVNGWTVRLNDSELEF